MNATTAVTMHTVGTRHHKKKVARETDGGTDIYGLDGTENAPRAMSRAETHVGEPEGEPLLDADNLIAGYLPGVNILNGASLTLHDGEIVTIENCAGKRLFRFSIDPGHRSPLHCTAPGKAIAAYLPDAILDATLSRMQFKRYNSRTITGEKAFRRELALVRQNGYATDDGEQYNGIYCVGSALLDRNGYPVATSATLPQLTFVIYEQL